MKKFKTALILLFAVVIVILVFFLVKNINNDNNQNNGKIISEIKYMDNKLMTLLNSMNGISLENYKISVTKTSTNSENQASGEEDNKNTTSGNQDNENSASKSSSGSGSSSNTTAEQYSLKEQRVLTNNMDIDWETIKNEIEILYSTVPTMTLDLYGSNVNQQEILNFNKELDELTIAVKEENKDETLIKLANLYRYLPAYAKNFSDNSEYVSLLETKSNVFNSYVFADQDDWDKAVDFTNKAINSFSPVLNNLKKDGNQYDNQKIYVILNELQSAANLKDNNVFLIKYKNFLEETQKRNTK